MSLLSTSTTLLLLAAAPAQSDSTTAQGFRLHEGLPAGFKADGKLDEWKTTPASFTLEAANQVDGASKVSSPQDLSAQVWVAIGLEGLAVAGEVRDDRVQLSTKPEQVNNDHVEVWLALPQPKMPPIAFVNQFGEHEVPTLAACDNNEAITNGTPADCRKWWKKQVDRRKQLTAPFTTQYGLLSGSMVRFGQKGKVGSIRYEPMPGGYRFEALIPSSAFPRSGEAPLRNVKVLVDLIDGDEGKGKLETVLSSSKNRRVGDPSTFNAVTLTKPLRFGAWPDLLERVVKANERTSYQPAPDIETIETWVNPARGYQFAPKEPSPDVVGVDMSMESPQGNLGDIEIVTMPAQVDATGAIDTWMVSRRGKTLLDAQNINEDTLRLTPRAPGLAILRVYEGKRSSLGTGACGSCPMIGFNLVKMDAQGHFSAPEEMEGTESEGAELEWAATPDLSRIEAFSLLKNGAEKHLDIRYTWNPKASRYDQEKFERPPSDDDTSGDTTP